LVSLLKEDLFKKWNLTWNLTESLDGPSDTDEAKSSFMVEKWTLLQQHDYLSCYQVVEISAVISFRSCANGWTEH
jgi:hypothetical protein